MYHKPGYLDQVTYVAVTSYTNNCLLLQNTHLLQSKLNTGLTLTINV